jgi:hypothetical protein
MSSASAPGSTTARPRSVRPSRFVVRTANAVRSPCGAQRFQPVAAGRRGGCSRSPQPPRPRQRTTTAELRKLAGSDWSEAAPDNASGAAAGAPPCERHLDVVAGPDQVGDCSRAQAGRSARRPLVNPTASHRGDRPKTRETAKTAGRAGFGAHNSSPKQATQVAVLQDFRSRRPDSNRGPLHYE